MPFSFFIGFLRLSFGIHRAKLARKVAPSPGTEKPCVAWRLGVAELGIKEDLVGTIVS